jgi:hypothetical protein
MNCFGKVLCEYLEDIPAFSEQYDIYLYYVMDCVSKIDLEKLKICDLFLYQHVSATALKCHNQSVNHLDAHNLTPESLMSNGVLPKNCINISIPSPYFSAYFTNSTHEHAIKALIDLPASMRDYFPNYCFSADLLNMLIKNDSLENMIKYLNDPNLFSKEQVLRNSENSLNQLRMREVANNVNVPMSDFIEENYQKKRLFHTTNHPTKHMFQFVINKIFAIIGIDHCVELSVDKMTRVGRVPILPCVYNHLGLTNSTEFNGPYFVQGKQVDSLEEYIAFYQSLFEKHGL